jgi:uncharacterized membrane protein YdjX (TVP38/TMEM64 family)
MCLLIHDTVLLQFIVATPVLLYVFIALQMDAYKDSLLYFMIFLRITPLVPNSFVNMASPVVGIPFHIFFFGTLLVSSVHYLPDTAFLV